MRTTRRASTRARLARASIPLVLVGAACGPADDAPPARVDALPPFDHHVHVLSPRLVTDWQSLGVPFSRPDSAYTSVSAMLGAGADGRGAFLVSMAHIYGSPDFREALGLDTAAEHAAVRAANDHVAGEVRRFPARFVGFCSVPIGRPYAVGEMRRCHDELTLGGLKVHLPNAGMRLGDEATLAAVAELMGEAAREGVAVLAHLASPDAEVSEADVAAFLERVVRPYPGLDLYLAHAGGGGGYRAPARNVVRGVAALLREEPERAIWVELSGTVLLADTDGVPASTPDEIAALAADLRALGLDRVVFGSDYPVFEPGALVAALRRRMGFTTAEAEAVLANRGRAFERARGG